jgi:hypothetical protein
MWSSERYWANLQRSAPIGIRFIDQPTFALHEGFVFHEVRLANLNLPIAGGLG